MSEWVTYMSRRVNARAEACFELKCSAILTLHLFLVLLLLSHTPALAQGNLDNRLEVALRAVDGAGVAGVTVTLAPRPAALGGPTVTTAARSAITNASGWVAFDKIPAGIWLLGFAGSAEGFPLQSIDEQGRPPYGTTANGGGFLVVVNDNAGEDIGTNDNDDSAGSRVTQALFVGHVRAGFWMPEYDLSDPSGTPEPLSGVPTPEPLAVVPTLDVSGVAGTVTTTSTTTTAATAAATPRVPATATAVSAALTTADGSDNVPLRLTPLLLCYTPGLLLGLGLLGWAWLARRHTQEERG